MALPSLNFTSCPYPLTEDPRLMNQNLSFLETCVLRCPRPQYGSTKDEALSIIPQVFSALSIIPLVFLLATQTLATIKQKKQFGDWIINSLMYSVLVSALVLALVICSQSTGDRACETHFKTVSPMQPSCFASGFFTVLASQFSCAAGALIVVHLTIRVYIPQYTEIAQSNWWLRAAYHAFLWGWACLPTALVASQKPWGPNIANSCSVYPNDSDDWWWIFGVYALPITLDACVAAVALSFLLAKILLHLGWKAVKRQGGIISCVITLFIIITIYVSIFYWQLAKRKEVKSSYEAWVICSAIFARSEKEAFEICQQGTHLSFGAVVVSNIAVSGAGLWLSLCLFEFKLFTLWYNTIQDFISQRKPGSSSTVTDSTNSANDLKHMNSLGVSLE